MSKILKIIQLLALLFVFSCINDLSFYNDSISDSKENGLLIDEYKSNKPEIVIGNKKYKIVEAWTAYKFKSRGSKEIYKDIFAFTFILEDSLKNKKPNLELIGLIECKNNDVLFDKRVGISDSQFRVDFDKTSINKLDTVKFVIKSSSRVFDSIYFIKN